MHLRTLRVPFISLLSVAVFACGDDGGPIFDADAAVDMGGADGGPAPDVTAPTVVSTDPADAEADVALDQALVIEFSEPMDTAAGLVRVTMPFEESYGAADGSWSGDGTVFTVTRESDWPESEMVRFSVETDFRDEAGNPLANAIVVDFMTAGAAPTITATTPAEGETDVSGLLETITVTFSESMSTTAGTASFSAGGASVVSEIWTDPSTLTIAVEGIDYATSYTLDLTGYTDRDGNAYGTEPTVGDGALDFTTGADGDAPFVTDADPDEGQSDVDAGVVAALTLMFNEPMDTSVGTATLEVGGASTAIVPTWSDGDSTAVYDVGGLLLADADHRLVLDGYTDVAGNALDGTVILGDSALDFTTGRDVVVPFVGFSDPVEGASDVSYERTEILLVFNEAMDTSTTEVGLSNGTDTATVSGVWSLAGTRLTLDVTGLIESGQSYTIDLTGFQDVGGTALDATHPYLVDGVLDFGTTAPGGEACGDGLTIDQATSVVDGVYRFEFGTDALTPPIRDDGAASCDDSGVPWDGLIVYEKTTAAGDDGGTYLTVRTDGGTSGTDLDVYFDSCDPTAVDADTARRKCLWNNENWSAFFDGAPGTYYIWFAPGGSSLSTFSIEVEEVQPVPAGESCDNPLTVGGEYYTAPATAGDPHTWLVPDEAWQSFDMDVTWGGEGTIGCDTGFSGGPITGADGVIAYEKTSADTVLEVVVTSNGSTGDDLNAEILTTCDRRDPARTSLACEYNFDSGSPFVRTFEGLGLGTYYIWVAGEGTFDEVPELQIEIREVTLEAGDSCGTAIPITPGATVPVTPSGTKSLFAPGCSPADEPLTWYKYTATQNLSLVTTDAAGLVATTAGTRELGCSTDATTDAITTFEATGEEVCIAVSSTAGITSLGIEEIPYTGVLGTPTQLNIERPIDSDGSGLETITGDEWMQVTPSTIYMGYTAGVVRAPKVGGVQADQLIDPPTSSELGNSGVHVGEALFSLDDADISAAGEPLTYRVVGTTGAPDAPVIAWDTGSPYVDQDFDAIGYDGTNLILASDTFSSETYFYSLDPTTPSSAVLLGQNANLTDVRGITADSTHLYIVGEDAGGTEGLYRLARADYTAPAEQLFTFDADFSNSDVAVDETSAYAYVRDDDGNIHVVQLGVTPRYLGVISTIGRSGDNAFDYDPVTGAIFLFETESASTGNFVRLD